MLGWPDFRPVLPVGGSWRQLVAPVYHCMPLIAAVMISLISTINGSRRTYCTLYTALSGQYCTSYSLRRVLGTDFGGRVGKRPNEEKNIRINKPRPLLNLEKPAQGKPPPAMTNGSYEHSSTLPSQPSRAYTKIPRGCGCFRAQKHNAKVT